MKYIDVHCHIDQYSNEEVEKILADDKVKVIGAAMNKESGDMLLNLKEKYVTLDICLGIHPEYPKFFTEFESVKKQIIDNKSKIVAIGEIGLPYYSLLELSKLERQKYKEAGEELLIKFLDLAEELNLPIVLHAIFDTAEFAFSQVQARKIKNVLFHWFEGELSTLKKIVESGYYISISPDVMFNEEYAEFVEEIPIENMVLESDGPWEYNGEKGKPIMVCDTLKYLSKKRNIPVEKLQKYFFLNACKLFNLHS